MYPYENLSLKDLPGEEWKAIEGFEGLYEISSYGRVKSLARESLHAKGHHLPERIRKLKLQVNGNSTIGDRLYCLLIDLRNEWGHFYFSVGRLVYNAFVARFDLDDKLIRICYRDGDGRNLHFENLFISNLSQMRLRSFREGRSLSHLSELSKPVSQFLPDGTLVAQYPSAYRAGKDTGFSGTAISDAASERHYLYKGFCWQRGKRRTLLSTRLPPKDDTAKINRQLIEKLGMKKIPQPLPAIFDLSLKSRPGERWKDIPGYEGLYRVSSHGRVKALKKVSEGSLKQWYPEKMKQLTVGLHRGRDGERTGTPLVTLCRDRKKRTFCVGRLVYFLFVAQFDMAQSTLRVYTSNGDPLDLHYRNLELRNAVWSIRR